MGDAEALALVLAAIYVSECVVRVRTGGIAVRCRGTGGGGAWRPAPWTEVAHGGFAFADPFPPFPPVLVCQPWTIPLAPDGVVSHLSGTSSDAAERVRFATWDEAADADARGADLLVGASPFATLVSAEAAAHAATVLRDIAGLPPGRRADAIEAAVARGLDADSVRARRDEWKRATSRLAVSAQVLFALCVAVVLGMAGVRWIEAVWGWAALGLVPAIVWTVSDAGHAHRRLFPGRDAARRQHLLICSLSPLSAIRAYAHVARDVFAAHDPLAVAAEFCTDDSFRRLAQSRLCDLRHPPPPAHPPDEPRAAAAEAWFRDRVASRTEAFLAARGVDAAALLAPPAARGPADRTWCPHCRAVYALDAGTCADCGGLPLLPLPKAS